MKFTRDFGFVSFSQLPRLHILQFKTANYFGNNMIKCMHFCKNVHTTFERSVTQHIVLAQPRIIVLERRLNSVYSLDCFANLNYIKF